VIKAFFFPVLAVWLLISSCSKQIYSHDQVLQSYHTKEDVLQQFGQPDEIMAAPDTVQWLYNCNRTSTLAGTKTRVKINGRYNSAAGVYSVPKTVKQFSDYEKYVKFAFSKDGAVLGWNSAGVNFAQRKAKPLATIGIVVASAAVVVFIAGSIVFDNAWDDFNLDIPF
jgi:hypothetical protein